MKRYLSVTLFGILVCVLTSGFILPEPLMNYGSNLAYAKPRGPVRPDDPSQPPPGPSPDRPRKPVSVPEPSTLTLLGIGALGVGFYVYRGRRGKG